MDTTSFFRALSDTTRLRCLALLAQEGELCVCELTHALGLPQPKISHHLAALRKSGIVDDRRQGLWVYYKLNPQMPAWMTEVLQRTAEGVQAEAPFVEDRAALASMPNRPAAERCA